jgi:hypothetical protein
VTAIAAISTKLPPLLPCTNEPTEAYRAEIYVKPNIFEKSMHKPENEAKNLK